MAGDATKWEGVPLDDLTEDETPITYGVVKPGEEGDVPFVRGGDIAGGRVLMNQLRTIGRDVSQQYRQDNGRKQERGRSRIGLDRTHHLG